MLRLKDVLLNRGTQLTSWRCRKSIKPSPPAYRLNPHSYSHTLTQLRHDLRKLEARVIARARPPPVCQLPQEKGIRLVPWPMGFSTANPPSPTRLLLLANCRRPIRKQTPPSNHSLIYLLLNSQSAVKIRGLFLSMFLRFLVSSCSTTSSINILLPELSNRYKLNNLVSSKYVISARWLAAAVTRLDGV